VCFFIIQIVATTDTAMAATIAPTKMPARALFFKPDDTIFGNSAKKEKKRKEKGGHIDLRFFLSKTSNIYLVLANERQMSYDAS
jgi:hypothetical protein